MPFQSTAALRRRSYHGAVGTWVKAAMGQDGDDAYVGDEHRPRTGVAKGSSVIGGMSNTAMPEQMCQRLEKRLSLLALGHDPYPPARYVRDHASALRQRYAALPPGTRTGNRVAVAGRIVGRRNLGAIAFATLRDGTDDIQLFFAAEESEAAARTEWERFVDLGDHVFVEGETITSRNGTLSVQVHRWNMTAKSLRPPTKRTGSAQNPATARHRYQRMMVDDREVDFIRGRASALQALRGELYRDGFVEVDTPVLHPVPGGTARPFTTRMNAWDVPLYLRGTCELYLKRLVVGGLHRIFEIGRVFRNEGADALHFPEFTLLEAYCAHTDYHGTADLTERLVRKVAEAMGDETAVHPLEKNARVVMAPFSRRSMHELLSERFGTTLAPDTPADVLYRIAARHGLSLDAETSASSLAVTLYRKVVQPRLMSPTFVFDLPKKAALLARSRQDQPDVVEAWSLVLAGREVGQGCTELTDPVEQRKRLTGQALRAAGGDPEAVRVDEDFLIALEHGLPALGGLGIGIERLLMALYGTSHLRDHQAHPIDRLHSRPRKRRT